MMYKENIRLEDAITLCINSNYLDYDWYMQGIYDEIKEISDITNISHTDIKDICVDSNKIETALAKFPEIPYYILRVRWQDKEGRGMCTGIANEFSTLEEMKKTYPKIFEMVGTLCIFSA